MKKTKEAGDFYRIHQVSQHNELVINSCVTKKSGWGTGGGRWVAALLL